MNGSTNHASADTAGLELSQGQSPSAGHNTSGPSTYGAPLKPQNYLGALMKGRAEALGSRRSEAASPDGQVRDESASTDVEGRNGQGEAPRPWVPPAAPTPSLPARKASPKPSPATAGASQCTAAAAGSNPIDGFTVTRAEDAAHPMYNSTAGSTADTSMGAAEGRAMPHLTHEQEAGDSGRRTNGGASGGAPDLRSYSLKDSFFDGASDGASSPVHQQQQPTQDGQDDESAAEGLE